MYKALPWSICYMSSFLQEDNRDLIDRWMAQKAKDAEKLNMENDTVLKLVML